MVTAQPSSSVSPQHCFSCPPPGRGGRDPKFGGVSVAALFAKRFWNAIVLHHISNHLLAAGGFVIPIPCRTSPSCSVPSMRVIRVRQRNCSRCSMNSCANWRRRRWRGKTRASARHSLRWAWLRAKIRRYNEKPACIPGLAVDRGPALQGDFSLTSW